MVLKIFSVFDSKACAFVQPYFAVNVAVALRDFANAAQTEGHAFRRYAGDYELFLLGEWDPHEGSIKMFDAKQSLGLASMYVVKEEER